MSNEIKVGDKVRVSKDAPKIFLLGWYGFIGNVVDIEDSYTKIECNDCTLVIPTKYLVKVDAEVKEAKFKVGDRVEELVSRKSGRVLGVEGDFVVVGCPYDKEKNYWHIDSVELVEPTEQTEAEKKPNVGSIKIPVEVDLTDSYWDAYTADLAKEIVLKTVKSASDKRPSVIAEYATDVAKAVVEGLKRK